MVGTTVALHQIHPPCAEALEVGDLLGVDDVVHDASDHDSALALVGCWGYPLRSLALADTAGCCWRPYQTRDTGGDMDPDRRTAFPGLEGLAARRRELVKELVKVRSERGLSQTEIAARMGTSQSAVARLERGDLDDRLSTLERYAAAVDRTLDWHVRPNQEKP
jgi:DNA-binding XRE family transcriptional regulator